jgi:hypothetical protein
VCSDDCGAKVVIRLIGGPADAFLFIVPVDKIPQFVAVGAAKYERELGDGEVIGYRFASAASASS